MADLCLKLLLMDNVLINHGLTGLIVRAIKLNMTVLLKTYLPHLLIWMNFSGLTVCISKGDVEYLGSNT